MTEAEGRGDGRCIIVLMGGRSGGHQAAVLGAVSKTGFQCGRKTDELCDEGFSSSASSHCYMRC